MSIEHVHQEQFLLQQLFQKNQKIIELTQEVERLITEVNNRNERSQPSEYINIEEKR